MDFCHLPTVTRSKVEYDSVLVVVCGLTGYVRAIPCNERMTSEQLASLFLEQVVSFFGLPKETFSDNDKVIDASFFSTLCKLSGIEEYRSPVYRARSNGRAERAVQVVIDSLRKFLEQVSAQKVKHKHTWLDLLPLAIWSATICLGLSQVIARIGCCLGETLLALESIPHRLLTMGRRMRCSFLDGLRPSGIMCAPTSHRYMQN